jgi:hypothetical protein
MGRRRRVDLFRTPSLFFVLSPSSFILHLPAMPAEARITPIWKKQKLFIAIFLLAVAGWFLWDGKVGYPRSNERWVAQEQYEQDGKSAEWPAYAARRGWSAEKPHKFFKADAIMLQLTLSVALAVLGGVAFAYWFTQKDRVLRSDEEAVYAPSGTRVPFGSITGLGKKKWDDKGLATVRYEMAGRKGQFVLDDYKFDRDPTHQILAEIEAQLTASAPASTAPGE